MQKHFMLIRATNWQLLFLYQLCCIQNRDLLHTFQTLFVRKQGLAHLYFLYENESLQHYLSYDLRQMARFLVRSVIFQALRSSFSADSFLGGPFFLRFSVLVRVWLLDERKKYEDLMKEIFHHSPYLSHRRDNLYFHSQNTAQFRNKSLRSDGHCWGNIKLIH